MFQPKVVLSVWPRLSLFGLLLSSNLGEAGRVGQRASEAPTWIQPPPRKNNSLACPQTITKRSGTKRWTPNTTSQQRNKETKPKNKQNKQRSEQTTKETNNKQTNTTKNNVFLKATTTLQRAGRDLSGHSRAGSPWGSKTGGNRRFLCVPWKNRTKRGFEGWAFQGDVKGPDFASMQVCLPHPAVLGSFLGGFPFGGFGPRECWRLYIELRWSLLDNVGDFLLRNTLPLRISPQAQAGQALPFSEAEKSGDS